MQNNIAITPELVAQHGLKPDEYQRILDLIGREPTLTELGIFSAMWNEHCSYKSSRLHLKGLPTKAPWVIQGPGENAGVIDIGDGLACVFKWKAITIRLTSNPIKVLRQALAVFCVMFSQWARVRLRR